MERTNSNHRGRMRRIACAGVSVALAGCLAAGLSGCSGSDNASSSSDSDGTTSTLSTIRSASEGGDLAMTVNNTIVYEDDLTSYIQSQRDEAGLSDDGAWGSYLADAGQSAQDVRSSALNQYLDTILINDAIANEGITVTDDEVESQFEQMKSYYDSFGENGWEQVREMSGYASDDAFKERLRNQMLSQKLREKVIADVTVSDDDVQSYLDEHIDEYAGKRAAFIIMPDDESAAQVKELIDSGALTFQEAVLTYSLGTSNAYAQAFAAQASSSSADAAASSEPTVAATAEDAQAARDAVKATYLGDDAWQSALDGAGDAGWFTESEIEQAAAGASASMGGVYVAALASLDAGEVSDPIDTMMGVQIIMCTESYDPAADGSSVSDMPDDLQEKVRDDALSAAQDAAWEAYGQSLYASASIDMEPMPAGLPYDVAIPSRSAGADEGESAERDAAKQAELHAQIHADDSLYGDGEVGGGNPGSSQADGPEAEAAGGAGFSMDIDISTAVGDASTSSER